MFVSRHFFYLENGLWGTSGAITVWKLNWARYTVKNWNFISCFKKITV